MLDFAPLLKIIPIFTLAVISPGPDFVMISSLALARGRRAAVAAAAGIAVGIAVYVTLCLWGMGLVLGLLQDYLWLVRVAGGLYLIWLGIQLWRASFQPPSTAETQQAPDQRNPFLIGFITNMTNPKAIAFFTSIFAVTLDPAATLPTQLSIIVAMMLVPFLWFSLVGWSLSTPVMKNLYQRASRWIDRVAGTCLTLFGLKMLLEEGR